MSEEEDKEKEKEVFRPVPFLITEKRIAEIIYEKGEAYFAVREFGKDTIETVNEIDLGEVDREGRPIKYVPLFNDHLKKGQVLVPEKPEPSTFSEVLKEGLELALQLYDCEEKYLKLFRFHVMVAQGSWFLDREVPLKYNIAGIGRFAPIQAARGPSGGGKNRWLQAMRLNAYRPFWDQSTRRAPSLFRPMDEWRGTLCLDEMDVDANENSDIIHYLNCRCYGTPISRQDPNNPRFAQVFDNFGLTIVTQRRVWQDDATENRTLPFYCEKSQKELPVSELDEWIARGLRLQNKMLYLRLLYWDKVKINKSARVPGVKDHRLTAAVLPVLALGEFIPEVRTDLTEILLELERMRREVRAQSDDGVIVNLLWGKVLEGLYSQYNGRHFVLSMRTKDQAAKEERDIPLQVSEIKDQLGWKSARKVRSVIHSLQLIDVPTPKVIHLTNGTYRPIFFSPERLIKRAEDFDPDFEESVQKLPEDLKSVTLVTLVTDKITASRKENLQPEQESKSVTSVTSVTKPEQTDPGPSKQPPKTKKPLDTLDTKPDEPQPSSPQGNITDLATSEGSSEQADAFPKPSQPIPANAQSILKVDTTPTPAWLVGRGEGRGKPRILAVGGAFWEVYGSLEGEKGQVAREALIRALVDRLKILAGHADVLVRVAIEQGLLFESKPGYLGRAGGEGR